MLRFVEQRHGSLKGSVLIAGSLAAMWADGAGVLEPGEAVAVWVWLVAPAGGCRPGFDRQASVYQWSGHR